MNKRHSALLMRTYVIMVFCFMYLPIAVMIAFSFNESKSRSNFTGFTLGWYKSLFHNEMILAQPCAGTGFQHSGYRIGHARHPRHQLNDPPQPADHQ